MKIYLMTDLEGTAGVVSFDEWTSPGKPYYELAKKFLALEVNAAAEGFFEEENCDILTVDGHGPGGVNIELLDRRLKYMRGWPQGPYPLGLDGSFDAVCFVGQHARAGTEYAHLAHTQGCCYIDLSVNGVSVGEFGQIAMCASELGVPVIFASGDKAFCAEAEELVPGIETAAVKEGLNAGKGEECTAASYRKRNQSAIHLHPEKARELIREKARKAAGEAVKNSGAEGYGMVNLKPPYERVAVFRPDETNPKRVSVERHPESVIELFNMPYNPKPCE